MLMCQLFGNKFDMPNLDMDMNRGHDAAVVDKM